MQPNFNLLLLLGAADAMNHGPAHALPGMEKIREIMLIVFFPQLLQSKIPVFKLMITISKWSNRAPYPNTKFCLL